MNSVYDFIIKPLGERYNNKVNIDNKELIINSSISDHKFVNRLAKVVSIPLAIKTNIKIKKEEVESIENKVLLYT